ncbi:hypothetical protein HMPREF0645_1020 [Hallella bergensis DSM 17361]|uniref:Uncharacterized protein n=1 Tax=Hallella bergensis DSM 17361 TaxID=585502 RepID=D1PVN5_9BACT|nr:hypothetical protein HMPREF0645_1020 [Hallella bergensis DSM 17361]
MFAITTRTYEGGNFFNSICHDLNLKTPANLHNIREYQVCGIKKYYFYLQQYLEHEPKFIGDKPDFQA